MSQKMTLQRAVREINDTLAALERDTESLVEDLGLQQIDSTQINSQQQQLRVSATIKMSRMPSHHWAT